MSCSLRWHLLISVGRHVLSKKIRRLRSDAPRLSVGTGAHQARPDHAGDASLDCSVDLRRRNNFIHQSPGLRVVYLECPIKKDGFPRKPFTNEAGESQVRRCRDDALSSRGQTEIRSSFRDNIVDNEQKLAPSSDCEGFDGSYPRFLERLLGFIIRFCQAADLIRTQKATIHLV